MPCPRARGTGPGSSASTPPLLSFNPAACGSYADGETVAADTAALLRRGAGRHPDSQPGELVANSPCAASTSANTGPSTDPCGDRGGTKSYHHPVVGALTVTHQARPARRQPDSVRPQHRARGVPGPDSGVAPDTSLLAKATAHQGTSRSR
ncbi:hypothetical protein ACFYT4_24955 [Streptomyces sp. NPDC004609]|uniref:MmyB family transcriptional regulator n=1 Tax=Streptomyces sp. NPDC004609 TaxID=3364704 RepID=UPI0036C1820E